MVSRSVMIIGGNRGIGLAVAQTFGEAGDNVTVTYRGELPADDKLFAVQCDVADTDAIDRAFAAAEERHGPVEVVVVNAGVTNDALLLRMSEEGFTTVLDTNLTGAYRVAKRAVSKMLRLRRGRLVFISSAVAMLGEAGQANYAASKAGLIGMARSLARELGSRGITVNVVAPGYTETDMTAGLTDERKTAMRDRIPLGRAASPAEVANVVVAVASEEFSYVTGAVIPVDGGVGMGH